MIKFYVNCDGITIFQLIFYVSASWFTLKITHTFDDYHNS